MSIRGGEVTSTGSYVIASNTGSVAGTGGINISADRLSLQDDPRSSSFVIANAHSAGHAVPINVRAQEVTMQNSDIRWIAYAAGKAGDIRIDAANQMTLDNFAWVLGGSLSSDPAGAAGNIMVGAGNLVIRDASQISIFVEGPAPAGNIDVTAGTLLIDATPAAGLQPPLTRASSPGRNHSCRRTRSMRSGESELLMTRARTPPWGGPAISVSAQTRFT